MFFEGVDLPQRRRAALKKLPETPETNWRPPSEFPNLSSATVISIDTETKENDFKHGPGWSRGKSHIVGFSVGARDLRGNIGRWYFPVRHEYETEYNLDPSLCFSWLRYWMHSSVPKVGANLIYDIGNLTDEDIFVQGPLKDCQFAEVLIDEDALVGLDTLGRKYLGRGKENHVLKPWILEAYNPPRGEYRADIYRTSPRLVGPYAEEDALLPLEVLEKQWPILVSQELMPVFEMECALIRMWVRMRIEGVQINVNYAHQLYAKFEAEIKNLYSQLFQLTGMLVNVQSPKDMGRLFDHCGIKHLGSFTKPFLEGIDHPVPKLVVLIRKFLKMNATFVKGYLLEGHVNGRLHGEFNPLRETTNDDDQTGAKTGRVASENPNLQNIPIRTKEGKLIRSAFMPDNGHVAWFKRDYSQIEYRYLAHYAVGPGSDDLRSDYVRNPKTDYHERVYDRAKQYLGWDNDTPDEKEAHRRPIKNTNFGLVFGQGQPKLARTMHLSKSQAKDFFEGFHKAAPYIKPTMASIAEEVQRQGYITTILGRRVHFKDWEPIYKREIEFQTGEPCIPCEYDAALRQWGSAIKIAKDYRGVNYRLQGSGTGDQIKKSMQLIYEAGIFDVTGMPKLQVHDELDFSFIDYSHQQHEAYREMLYLMENAIPLTVPVFVDDKMGANWGECK